LILEEKMQEEPMENLYRYWLEKGEHLNWPGPFITPPFLEAWWESFGSGELFLRSFWEGEILYGVAPLMVEKRTARIVGSGDVCDYHDFPIKKGFEKEFYTSLLHYLKEESLESLEVASMRADSSSLCLLVEVSDKEGLGLECFPEEVMPVTRLPASWEEYLQGLSKKQRHEVRRKIRRLKEAGEVKYRVYREPGEVQEIIPLFLELFKNSRLEKAEFLTPRREKFFRNLLEKFTKNRMALLGVLELDGNSVASVFCFDYGDTVYLYNSGYYPEYSHLSAGLLSKVFMIGESISAGKDCFNFLKGNEDYKYRLGGINVPTYRVKIHL